MLSEDVELNPVPRKCNPSLKFCSLNARSIVNKLTEFQAVVTTKKVNLIAVTETWVNSGILQQEIMSTDFIIFRRDRLGRGGVVMLAASNSICCYRRSDLETVGQRSLEG